MPSFAVPPLAPGCPWSDWTPPNIKWCEENLCAWITAPSNTWSNLAYIVLGLLMWHQARRMGSRTLGIFGPASVFVGITSLAYHASYTFFLQFFDFVGMFVFFFAIIVLNGRRLGSIGERQFVPAFLGGVIGCSALVPLLFYTGIPIQLIVMVLIAVILSQEWRLSRRDAGPVRYRLYLGAIGLLAGGAICSALDVTRVWCDPTNHWLQGHAAWHVLTAGSLYLLFLFYRQFRYE
jgi:hypothetical protein